jgi:hypothetical protein
MKLYDHNGDELIIIRYRESMGFVPTYIPIEEDDEESEAPLADLYSAHYVDFGWFGIECDPIEDK